MIHHYLTDEQDSPSWSCDVNCLCNAVLLQLTDPTIGNFGQVRLKLTPEIALQISEKLIYCISKINLDNQHHENNQLEKSEDN